MSNVISPISQKIINDVINYVQIQGNEPTRDSVMLELERKLWEYKYLAEYHNKNSNEYDQGTDKRDYHVQACLENTYHAINYKIALEEYLKTE